VEQFFQQLSRWLENFFGLPRERAAAKRTKSPPPGRLADHVVVHECGHASIAWMSPAVFNVEGIVFHPGGGATTRASFIKSRSDYRSELLVYTLGGMVGELLVRKKVHTGGLAGRDDADLPAALELAETIAAEGPTVRLEQAWKRGLAEPSFDVAAMFRRRPPDAVAEVLNLAYRRGKHLLTVNRPGFDRLCRLAAGRRDLSREDIASQFGPRLWAPGSRPT